MIKNVEIVTHVMLVWRYARRVTPDAQKLFHVMNLRVVTLHVMNLRVVIAFLDKPILHAIKRLQLRVLASLLR